MPRLSIVVALLLTWSLVPVVIRLVPDGLPRVESIRIDVAVVLFSIASGLAAAVAAGLWSALKTARASVSDELRTGGTRSTRALTRSRGLLIIGETAIAVIVIAGAVMVVRSLIALQSVDMGLAADKILFVDLELPGTRYVARQARVQLLKDVTVALPGGPIASATPVNVLPFSGTGGWDLARFTAEGQSEEAGASNPSLNLEAIGATYFDTFQIELSRGRAFSEYDRQGQPNVAIVSEDVAARLWPATDAIGKRLKMGTLSSKGAWWTIVGVVKGTRYRDLLDARPTLYVPAEQFVVSASIVAVRTTAPASAVAARVGVRLRPVVTHLK
jgi:putative ABC transport system permease protein